MATSKTLDPRPLEPLPFVGTPRKARVLISVDAYARNLKIISEEGPLTPPRLAEIVGQKGEGGRAHARRDLVWLQKELLAIKRKSGWDTTELGHLVAAAGWDYQYRIAVPVRSDSRRHWLRLWHRIPGVGEEERCESNLRRIHEALKGTPAGKRLEESDREFVRIVQGILRERLRQNF